MAKKLHSTFIKELKEKHPILFNSIEFIENYNGDSFKILIKTKYGICNVVAGSLLAGYFPSIMSAVNKTEYFKNKLKDKNPKFFINNVIVSDYIKDYLKINIQTKYGICKITPSSLIKGTFPSIMSAVSKTEYFIAHAREVHGDLYDYSLVEYVNNIIKIKLICPIHGIFEQSPADHLSKYGCQKCGNNRIKLKNIANYSSWGYSKWKLAGNKSKNFESFKCYIIKCWNDDETFYKIGKTFKKISLRFSGKEFPYNYKIVKIIEGDAQYISELEIKLHNNNKKNSYKPKIYFKGESECFSEVNLHIERKLLNN